MTEYKIGVVLSLSILYAYTTLSCHSVGIVELCHPVLAAVLHYAILKINYNSYSNNYSNN